MVKESDVTDTSDVDILALSSNFWGLSLVLDVELLDSLLAYTQLRIEPVEDVSGGGQAFDANATANVFFRVPLDHVNWPLPQPCIFYYLLIAFYF